MALAPSCCLAGGLPCPALEAGGPERYARWGDQLDVRNITRDDQAGELLAEQVAGYIAKYATKATESFGAGLDRRLTGDDDLDHLDKLPAHMVELVRACWELGGRPELDGLRLRAWAHMLGFRGIGRPRAAATRPPSRSYAGPGSRSPSAAEPATVCPWTPGADPRTTRP
jgi:hypothetical protein